MGLLRLAISRTTKSLINVGGTPTSIPPLYQSSLVSLRVSVYDGAGNFTSPFVIVDETGFTMRAWIGPTPIGGAETPDVLAQNTGLTWNSGGKYFEGSID